MTNRGQRTRPPEVLGERSPGQARILEGLITGIGFIGGGAILKNGGEVHGTATAASLWATGAIGIAVGLGNYDVAAIICLFTIATLYVLSRLKPEKAQERAPRTPSLGGLDA